MPGSVANAVPATVLPQTLCAAFRHSRNYPLVLNEYRDGTAQRELQAASSRKSWVLAKHLGETALGTLRTFYEARKGGKEAFYFYDPYSPATGQPVGSNYDGSGTSTTGRHTVRFNGDWSQSVETPGRFDAEFGLIELA